MKKVLCPVCWHEETLRAIFNHREPIRDDTSTMIWQRPYGGARGQVVTMWDGGRWHCQICGISFPAHMAALMVDAVLRVSDPDNDSFDGKTFEDAKIAASAESWAKTDA